MKAIKLIDLIFFANEKTDITLDRTILFTNSNLTFIFDRYKYLIYKELKRESKSTDNVLLDQWLIVFKLFLKSKSEDRKLEKQANYFIKNLQVLCFSDTSGFKLKKQGLQNEK
ncbi:hypothetical protein CRV08_02000 [Halarcobacter ebronensis]|uniref:Uncharacterized protein n=1 Tax=Halarcobacter ebronensis TaxID=1462615 RepID=A0A4V1LRV3_9BACT|nr:hypothetical protein [Halarcobacter ebronensis]RXJ69498.1 hypothetical protein CRV08_02000 [Halarcobacter ebronensis]